MTRVTHLRTSWLMGALLFVGIGSMASAVPAQTYDRHFQHFSDLPPGHVGRLQLGRGGPLQGYFQPVEILAPDGAQIGILSEGTFQQFQDSRVKAGMLIGEVYRTRITHIEGHAGFEVYPTIELINRLYPPAGQEVRFPVPIYLSQEDLELAIDGKYVVRVVYLEDPSLALPVRQRDGEQHTTEVGPLDDPLVAADQLGRPMAIVRIGARVPDELLSGGNVPSPPVQFYAEPQDRELR